MMLKKLTEALQMVEAGYDGYSMSNNARAAYDAGMMPLSKWTKSDILNGIREEYNIPEEVYAVIAKLPLGYLRDKFLETREWHHTSSMYNATDFYQIDADYLDTDTTVEGMIDFLKQDYAEWKADYDKERAKKKAVKDSKGDFCYFKYLVWGGSRAHPRAYEEESYGFVKGDWIYFADENGNLTGGKKGLYSNGTEILRYLEPKTAPVQKKEKVIPVGTEEWYLTKGDLVKKEKGFNVLKEVNGEYILGEPGGGGQAVIRGEWSKPIQKAYGTVIVDGYSNPNVDRICPKDVEGILIIKNAPNERFNLSDVRVGKRLDIEGCDNLKTLDGIPQAKVVYIDNDILHVNLLKSDIEKLRRAGVKVF